MNSSMINLIFIIILAFTIRIINPTFGSPALYTVPDEVPNYLAAFEMLSQKTLITSSQYPPLGSYVLIPFFGATYLFLWLTHHVSNISQFELFILTHEGYLLFIPRLISALFGTASLLIVYKLTRLILPKRPNVAFWATFIVAFSTTHVQLSHIGKPWMPSQFFYLLGIYWCYKSLDKVQQQIKFIFFSALSFVLAIGFHFSAIYGLLLLLLLFLQSKRKILPYNQSLLTLTVLIGIPLVSLSLYKMLMTYTYQLSEFQNILTANINQGLLSGLGFYTKEFILTEPMLFILLLISIFMVKHWPKLLLPIMSYSTIYFLIMAITFYQSLRYLLPIIPLLSIPAAFVLNHILVSVKNKYVLTISTGLIILLLIFPSLLWLSRYNNTPTFIEMQTWLNRHIDPNLQIALTSIRFSPFVPDREAMKVMQVFKPSAWGQLAKVLTPKDYPETVRNVVYLEITKQGDDPDKTFAYAQNQKIKYIIQLFWTSEKRLVTHAPPHWRLIKHITPRHTTSLEPLTNLIHGSANVYELLHVNRFGPYIDVLEFNEFL